MNVKIVRLADQQHVAAQIKRHRGEILPSLTDGWRFNFQKHSRKPNFETYILGCNETPDVIEGCLIFELKDAKEPYMAYIEIAPHNMGKNRRYDKVAGCLIAFACRLGFIKGQGYFKGWLAFDVMEADKEEEIKLMAVYCKKYGALRCGDTMMVISPEAGENLINTFLN